MPDRSDDAESDGSPRRNETHDGVVRPAAVDDEAPPSAFVSAETTEEHVEAIRAELEARGVPKPADALAAILTIDSDVMTLTEFEIALEVALDRGVVERTGAGLAPAE